MDENRTVRPGHNGGGVLRPFIAGDPRTKELGRKGAASRELRRAGRRSTSEAVSATMTALRTAHDRGTLGATAFAAAADLIGRVVTGEVTIRHASDAAELLRALVDIGRLESGDPTRTVAVAHLSGPQLAARLRELQALGDGSAAAQAADDAPAPSVTL
jgi:hypothetical protein